MSELNLPILSKPERIRNKGIPKECVLPQLPASR